MKTFWSIVVLTVLVGYGKSDIIVLKDGKKFSIPGTYEVKRNLVIFKDKRGELTQLPLRMVDLEKSWEATQAALKAKIEREQAKAAKSKAKPEKGPRELSMSEIAADVEKNRDPEKESPTSFSISGDGLSKYVEENPAPENTQADSTLSAAGRENRLTLTADEYSDKLAKYASSYKAKLAEIASLEKTIEQTKKNIAAHREVSAFGNQPTGNQYDLMVEAQKQLKEQEKNLAEAKKALADIKREAAKDDIRGLDRIK